MAVRSRRRAAVTSVMREGYGASRCRGLAARVANGPGLHRNHEEEPDEEDGDDAEDPPVLDRLFLPGPGESCTHHHGRGERGGRKEAHRAPRRRVEAEDLALPAGGNGAREEGARG